MSRLTVEELGQLVLGGGGALIQVLGVGVLTSSPDERRMGGATTQASFKSDFLLVPCAVPQGGA